MAAPLERTRSDLEFLNHQPRCRAQKMIGTIYGTSGLDIFGCISGRFFFLEKKQAGKKPTPRQQARLRQWTDAGAITGWYTTRSELIAIFAAEGIMLV